MDPAPVVRISLVRFLTEMWCPAILNFSFHSSFWWRSASPQLASYASSPSVFHVWLPGRNPA